MKLSIRVNGVEELRRRVTNVAECAVAGTLTRRGLTQVGQIVTRAQKNMAPVRKGRVRLRQLNKRLKKGMEIGKATRLSSVAVVKVRKMPKDFIGPGNAIKPGLIKRSIGYRVLRQRGYFVVKMGMNVGKKKSNANYAPHASLVGLRTNSKPRYANGKLKGAEYGPKRAYRGIMPRNHFVNDATQFAASAAIAALDKAVQEDTVRAYKLSLRASRVVMQ